MGSTNWDRFVENFEARSAVHSNVLASASDDNRAKISDLIVGNLDTAEFVDWIRIEYPQGKFSYVNKGPLFSNHAEWEVSDVIPRTQRKIIFNVIISIVYNFHTSLLTPQIGATISLNWNHCINFRYNGSLYCRSKILLWRVIITLKPQTRTVTSTHFTAVVSKW